MELSKESTFLLRLNEKQYEALKDILLDAKQGYVRQGNEDTAKRMLEKLWELEENLI